MIDQRCLTLALVASIGAPSCATDSEAGVRQESWKAALVSADCRIPAFDNARRALKELVVEDGVLDEDTIQLSCDRRMLSSTVRPTSLPNLEAALLDLDAGAGDACFLHMTSHGTPFGFVIGPEGFLPPGTLDRFLDEACADLPTVVLISACYSGVFIEPLAAPNRIVLTAARADRVSFGCTVEATYTSWDDCLIRNWNSADTWEGLYVNVTRCVQAREEAAGLTPSLPQAFFGEEVQELRILAR